LSTITTSIDKAVACLLAGDVVAIPTETVYGLAGNLFNPKAVEKIYSLKKRPKNNPLIVHVKDLSAVTTLVTSFPGTLLQLAEKYWPGPLTILLKKTAVVPDSITAGSDLVAVRIPAHPVTKELLEHIPFPLVAPSANPFTRISPTKAAHVHEYFGESIPCILDGGNCTVGLESTIIGIENNKPVIYREGILGKSELEKIVGPISKHTTQSSNVLTPGQWRRHYAPQTRTILCERDQIWLHIKKNSGVILLKEPLDNFSITQQHFLSETGSLHEAARNLYQVLHHADDQGYDQIICEKMPAAELGHTINERLSRAAEKNNWEPKEDYLKTFYKIN